MIVYINGFDNDYHTFTKYLKKEFTNIEEAEQWCKDASWSGYSYDVDKDMTKAVNESK